MEIHPYIFDILMVQEGNVNWECARSWWIQLIYKVNTITIMIYAVVSTQNIIRLQTVDTALSHREDPVVQFNSE